MPNPHPHSNVLAVHYTHSLGPVRLHFWQLLALSTPPHPPSEASKGMSVSTRDSHRSGPRGIGHTHPHPAQIPLSPDPSSAPAAHAKVPRAQLHPRSYLDECKPPRAGTPRHLAHLAHWALGKPLLGAPGRPPTSAKLHMTAVGGASSAPWSEPPEASSRWEGLCPVSHQSRPVSNSDAWTTSQKQASRGQLLTIPVTPGRWPFLQLSSLLAWPGRPCFTAPQSKAEATRSSPRPGFCLTSRLRAEGQPMALEFVSRTTKGAAQAVLFYLVFSWHNNMAMPCPPVGSQ